MIEVKSLCKQFGIQTAVDDISFSVNKGDVLGFLGPNGAGKSTTMKMLAGFLTPTSGTAVINGFDITQESLQVKSIIGYLPEGAPAYGDMTPLSFLDFVARIRGYKKAEREQRINDVIEKINLQSVIYKPIDTLSKGFKRRVGLAQAIIHDPPVLIMDEPTDGLDPNQKHEVRELIKTMAEDKAIIVSTHILEEVQAVCTRATIIAQGKLLFDGTPDELTAQSDQHNAVTVVLPASCDTVPIEKKIKSIDTVRRIKRQIVNNDTTRLTVIPQAGKNIINRISELGRSENWPFEQIVLETGQLDEVFRDITTQSDVIEKGSLS
ncbi:MAG: ABC transporter ATP-binding protein [Gammaproteobacteria bacterium]